MGDELCSRFLSFVEQARVIRDESPELDTVAVAPTGSPDDVVADFPAFIEKAAPLVTGRARQALARIAPDASRIVPWLVTHDLISVAGYSRVENSYTRLLQWALSGGGRADLSLAVQRALLQRLIIDYEPCEPLRVQIEISTGNGRPDLVLFDSDLVIVIEAKTDSPEHVTPRGEKQTDAYLSAVREHLRMPNARGELVFLTPDRRAAANREAKLLSFADVAFVLAHALARAELSPDLRASYAMLITHWLERTAPPGLDVQAAFPNVPIWREASDEALVEHLGTIQKLADLHHGNRP